VADGLSRPVADVEATLAEGRYLGADEALALRLVHEIARPQGAVTPMRPQPGYTINHD
jgi:hypothetical protein